MADRKMWAVIRREYLERVRTRWFLIGTLFGPLLIGTLMILPSVMARRDRDKPGDSRIVILDATGSALGERVAERLMGGIDGTASTNRARVQPVTSGAIAAAESLLTQRVMADSLAGYLVLDSATLASGDARYAGRNTTAIFAMQRLERSLQSELLVQRMGERGIDAEIGRQLAATKVDISTEQLSDKGRGGSGKLNLVFGMAVALLLYMMVFVYGLNVLRGVLEEKQTRVAEVVIASIAPARLLIGKVIGVGSVGLTQMVIWFATSALLWQARAPLFARFGIDAAPMAFPEITALQVGALLVFFVAGFLFYAGLFAAAGATVGSEQEAQQAQMPIVLLLVSSITLAQNILMQPEGSLARIMSMLPHSAPIIMPLRMTVAPVPISELVTSLLSVSVGAIVSIWLASRIYRVGLLMYGKRPSFKEVLTWVRRR